MIWFDGEYMIGNRKEDLGVNSSSKCTTCGLIKDFIGCLVVEALSWSIINLSDDHFKFFNGNILEISALWEIEPQYPVGIFVAMRHRDPRNKLLARSIFPAL